MKKSGVDLHVVETPGKTALCDVSGSQSERTGEVSTAIYKLNK